MRILALLTLVAMACSSGGGSTSRDGSSPDQAASGRGGTSGSGGTAAGGSDGSAGHATATGGATASGGATGGASTGSGGPASTGGARTAGGTGGTTRGDASPRAPLDAAPDAAAEVRRADATDLSIADGNASDARASDGGAALPSPATVLEAMRRADDFFLARWPDPTADIVTDKARPSNLWTRAVYFEGLMALYAVEPDEKRKANLYDYAVRWGESPSHPWTLTYTATGTMTSNADNQACGQTYIDLYRIEAQPERIATIKANIDDMVARGTASAWTWIDAIQMAMPVFARLGAVTADARYFDAMWKLYDNARSQQGGGLRNPDDGLWWRDLHFTPGGGTEQRMTAALNDAIPGSSTDAYIVAPNGQNLYWSRGNGWVMAALVRVLDLLPATDSHRATYVADFQSIAAALLPVQRSDGFWDESLLDPGHCSSIGLQGQDGPETSGTALFTYGLAWGIRQGLLDGPSYGAALTKAWQGLVSVALQSDGRLGYVQSTGDRPCTDSAALGPTTLANFDDYGVGTFLLAGSEVYRLAN